MPLKSQITRWTHINYPLLTHKHEKMTVMRMQSSQTLGLHKHIPHISWKENKLLLVVISLWANYITDHLKQSMELNEDVSRVKQAKRVGPMLPDRTLQHHRNTQALAKTYTFIVHTLLHRSCPTNINVKKTPDLSHLSTKIINGW